MDRFFYQKVGIFPFAKNFSHQFLLSRHDPIPNPDTSTPNSTRQALLILIQATHSPDPPVVLILKVKIHDYCTRPECVANINYVALATSHLFVQRIIIMTYIT